VFDDRKQIMADFAYLVTSSWWPPKSVTVRKNAEARLFRKAGLLER